MRKCTLVSCADHPRYIEANAGCKHFDVHGGPENIPVSRFSFNAEVSERDWRTTFLPQFEACARAGTFSFMCSYNRCAGEESKIVVVLLVLCAFCWHPQQPQCSHHVPMHYTNYIVVLPCTSNDCIVNVSIDAYYITYVF